MRDHPELSSYHGLPTAAVDILVAYHDIDSMGVVWHGNYVKYFEIARCAVLQAIDYDFAQMQVSGYVWPIVDLRARFVLATKYDDKLQIEAIITEWDLRLLIKYLIINKSNQRVVARGQSVQVPLVTKTMAMTLGCPAVLEQKIQDWQQANCG